MVVTELVFQLIIDLLENGDRMHSALPPCCCQKSALQPLENKLIDYRRTELPIRPTKYGRIGSSSYVQLAKLLFFGCLIMSHSRWNVWCAWENGAPQKSPLDGAAWLTAAGLATADAQRAAEPRAGVLLVPAMTAGKRAAVAAIVHDAAAETVSVNGRPLDAGIHQLGHADQLQLGSLKAWLAESRQADVVQYDPAIHGAAQRCGRTKAPLRPGDRIVLCPGCRTIFSERAYGLMRPCEYCPYDPKQGEWLPPAATDNATGLTELLALLGVARTGNAHAAAASAADS
jgi:hypothetical protein